MATLDELYTRVLADEAERVSFAEAVKTPEGLSAFLKDHGCEATPEQVAEFLKAQMPDQGEMSDAELDSVAGGCNVWEGVSSAVTVGVACAIMGGMSAALDAPGGDDGQILCDTFN